MTNNIHSLADIGEWLKRLNDIPKKKVRKETLLDIAGIGHLENHWSDIYAYFFNPKASHGLSMLFIDSLQDIIYSKTGQLPLVMKTFSVLRENGVHDENGNTKRIDLLLLNEDEAIIIENKVHAPLYNKLDLYWSKPDVPEENKRGVVLSPWTTDIKYHRYVNITHEEFAHAIEKNLPAYFTNANPKALILLQDFIQNIYNVTHAMNEEEVYFYFENREKINRLAEIRKNVVTHIWETIEDCKKAQLIRPLFRENGLKLSIKTKNNVDYCYYTFDAAPEKVMLTLVYETLWNFNQNGCRIRMFLELQGDMIKFAKEHTEELTSLGVVSDGNNKPTSWWHFRGYVIPFTPRELSDENSIAQKIISAIIDSHFYDDGMKIINLRKKGTVPIV